MRISDWSSDVCSSDLPMAFFILWFSVFEVLARATYKTIFATFLREFFLKLASAAGLLLVLFGYMNFSSFLIYYIVIYGLICLFLLLQLVTSEIGRASCRERVCQYV